MTEAKIDGRPVSITKEGGKIKVVFHPITKNAKHPNAAVFSIKLAKTDLDMLKKAL